MSGQVIRVLRVLEYTYPDAESMIRDRMQWQIQGGVKRVGYNRTIKSTVMEPEMITVEEVPGDDSDC